MDLVPEAVGCFRKDLEIILGSNLYEIVIHGSYALGDFTPHRGDLDYMVATVCDLDVESIRRLFDLHDGYRREKHGLLYQLEGTFYPLEVLREPWRRFVGCCIGTGRQGWRQITTFQNSYLDLMVMREHGIAVLGRSIEFYRPTPEEIRQEFLDNLARLSRPLREAPEASIGLLCALVHACARAIYYYPRCRLSSKGTACGWCKEQPMLREFALLFAVAQTQRYPYVEDQQMRAQMHLIEPLLAWTERWIDSHYCGTGDARAESGST